MKNLLHLFSYITLNATYAVLKKLPYSILSSLMKLLSLLAYAIGIRRKVVEVNLGSVLGTPPDKGLIKKTYEHFGKVIASGLAPAKALDKYGDNLIFDGKNYLREALSANKGVILLTGHVGPFLLGAYLLKKSGFSLTIAGKKMGNQSSNQIVEKIYGELGDSTVLVTGFKNDASGAKKLLQALKENKIVIVLNDQDAGRGGYQSKFFGIHTFIPKGPSHLALKTGARVLTGFVYNDGENLVVKIQPPIDYSSATTQEEAEKAILDEYSRRLEAIVKKHPEQYFWFHKKWKSHPEIAKYYR